MNAMPISDPARSMLGRSAYLSLLNFAVAFGIIVFFLADYSVPTGVEPAVSLLLFFVIGIYSIVMYSRASAEQGLSTQTLFWFFSLWFFFIAPLTQYIVGDIEFAPLVGPRSIYLSIVLLWLLVFDFFYKRVPLLSATHLQRTTDRTTVEIVWLSLIVISSILSLWVIAYASRYSYVILILRIPDASLIQGSLAAYLITNLFARPGVMIAFLLACIKMKNSNSRNWRDWAAFAYLGMLMIVINFPTSQARYYVFAEVICFLMVVFPRLVRGPLFANVFLLISMIGSSIFHIFRGVRGQYDVLRRLSFGYLHEGHFSSFSNFGHVVNYVNEYGIRWGEQLLGAFFFWVPRSVWSDKPIGTGEFIVKEFLEWELGLTFTNIAMPAIAEFFIDFHIVGVVIGAALFSLVSANIDRWYVASNSSKITHLRSVLLTGYVTGLWIFINRGDFQSAIAYTVGIIIAVLCVISLSTRQRREL